MTTPLPKITTATPTAATLSQNFRKLGVRAE
jgi:hypothetical protein